MLTHVENETLTRTGPGTSMGDVLRRYWMPALMSREIPEPDCPPVRVSLLGEKLVAFRDTSGRIGLIEEACPHRLASLFLGRNEEDGLRCVYHGWKFNVEGKCLDMMNELPGSDYKDKMQTPAYPTYEAGGVVWAYMAFRVESTLNLRERPASRRPVIHRRARRQLQNHPLESIVTMR